MKNPREFYSNKNTANKFNKRLEVFVKEYHRYKDKRKENLKLLDIGCGKNAELFPYKRKGDIYYGCDLFNNINVEVDNYTKIDLNEESLCLKYNNKKFDVIFCGEVIEHLFSPDDLLGEIRSVMHSKSILILSTPNFGYWVNRLFLLFGISPLFLENSSEFKLGRKFKFLGQFNETQGHIRLFTYGAIKDLLKLKNLKIIRIIPVPVWNTFLDKIICCFSNSLAPDNVFVVKK